jgi:hypothetical protein
MAEIKISELPETTTPGDNDLIPIVQGGITKNVKKSNLVTGGGAWGSITGTLSDQTDLQSELNNKVDKVIGKGLSTEDYTTTEKTKLSGISANAIALTALSASSPLNYNDTTGAFTIQAASGSQNGYLSSTDWNTFNNKQSALSSGAGISIVGGTIACTITNNNQLTNGSGYITGITSGNVTTALGYTPFNRAGDTLSGSVVLSANNTHSIGGSTLALTAAYSRLLAADNASGTDIVGTDLVIQAGKGTGGGVRTSTNISALVTLQAPQIAASGSSAQTLGNVMLVGCLNTGTVGSPTNSTGIWLNATPSDNNYTLLKTGSALFINSPSGTFSLRNNSSDRIIMPTGGGVAISQSSTMTYRLTSAGSNQTGHLVINPTGNAAAGTFSVAVDNTNGLSFNRANGSNAIRRASFALTNNTDTAASELSDLELTLISGGSFSLFSNILFYNGVPGSNPASGKIYVYYDSGALKARSSSGTITTIAAL